MPENQAPQQLDPDTAYALIHQRVYAPVFFEKLARDYGIRANGPQEQYDMLVMASQLRAAHDAEQEKQAATGSSRLSGMRQHLQEKLASSGVVMAQNNDRLVKEAAAKASLDPELAHAILSMQASAAGLAPQRAA